MLNYSKAKFVILSEVFLVQILIWVPFSYFIKPQTSRLNPYYVQQRMIQEKLYLIDQTQRPQKFADLIDLLRHVDSFRRLEILRGVEMKKWFNKLMFVEKAAIMEEILPQPVIQLIQRFLREPEDGQIAYLYRVGEVLLASNKVSISIKQQMAKYQTVSFEDKKKMIRSEIQKYGPDQRYYKILEILFDKFNGQTNPLNPAEQAQVMMLDEIMNQMAGSKDKDRKSS